MVFISSVMIGGMNRSKTAAIMMQLETCLCFRLFLALIQL
jgi:hypothetical protein